MTKTTSQPAPACRTCFKWEHKVRGRTCQANRRGKINGKKVTGTPADYLCNEYVPLTHATCADCVHWTDQRLPRKKAPCSELGLQDDRGRERTAESTFCKRFQQKASVTLHNNTGLRIDGVLASVIDISQHSTHLPLVVRSGDNSGILLKWDPHGPGAGEWVVAPVELDEQDGVLRVTQHETGDLRAQREVLFSGSASLQYPKGEALRVYGQSFASRAVQDAANKVRQGISAIVLRVNARRKRRGSDIAEKKGRGVLEAAPAKRIQDEPWGSDWDDLKEQMENLLDAGTPPSKAARRVRKAWEKDVKKRLGEKTATRLEAQLKVEFR